MSVENVYGISAETSEMFTPRGSTNVVVDLLCKKITFDRASIRAITFKLLFFTFSHQIKELWRCFSAILVYSLCSFKIVILYGLLYGKIITVTCAVLKCYGCLPSLQMF